MWRQLRRKFQSQPIRQRPHIYTSRKKQQSGTETECAWALLIDVRSASQRSSSWPRQYSGFNTYLVHAGSIRVLTIDRIDVFFEQSSRVSLCTAVRPLSSQLQIAIAVHVSKAVPLINKQTATGRRLEQQAACKFAVYKSLHCICAATSDVKMNARLSEWPGLTGLTTSGWV